MFFTFANICHVNVVSWIAMRIVVVSALRHHKILLSTVYTTVSPQKRVVLSWKTCASFCMIRDSQRCFCRPCGEVECSNGLITPRTWGIYGGSQDEYQRHCEATFALIAQHFSYATIMLNVSSWNLPFNRWKHNNVWSRATSRDIWSYVKCYIIQITVLIATCALDNFACYFGSVTENSAINY